MSSILQVNPSADLPFANTAVCRFSWPGVITPLPFVHFSSIEHRLMVDLENSISILENDEMKLGVEGYASIPSGTGSQRIDNEYLHQEIAVGDGDSHLVEFSDTLQCELL